jgi:hypothetical protein
MAYQAATWRDFYFGHPDNEVSNSQMEQFITLFSAGAPEVDFISQIQENQGLAAIAIDHFNRVLLFHQLAVLGPNLQYPDQIIMALSGSNYSALAFRILPSSFTDIFEITCPPGRAIVIERSAAFHLRSIDRTRSSLISLSRERQRALLQYRYVHSTVRICRMPCSVHSNCYVQRRSIRTVRVWSLACRPAPSLRNLSQGSRTYTPQPTPALQDTGTVPQPYETGQFSTVRGIAPSVQSAQSAQRIPHTGRPRGVRTPPPE